MATFRVSGKKKTSVLAFVSEMHALQKFRRTDFQDLACVDGMSRANYRIVEQVFQMQSFLRTAALLVGLPLLATAAPEHRPQQSTPFPTSIQIHRHLR